MKNVLALTYVLSVVFGCSGGAPGEPSDVSEASLLREMVDRDAITRWPEHPHVTRMESSFDRDSLSGPDNPNWFANVDKGAFDTLLEVQGAGAIVRIWSANPRGQIRIFIDGETTPSIDEDIRELLHGNVDGFGEPFGFVASFGYNLYYPIPFSQGVRVESTRPDEHLMYHQITYRLYSGETTVQPFGASDPDLSAARAAAADAMSTRTFDVSATDTMTGNADATPFRIDAHPGGSVVRAIRMTAPWSQDALRAAILNLTFDGEATVRVPLGDFFGSAPGLTDSTSAMTSMTAGGALESRWVMPFAREMTLHVDNGPAPVPFEVLVSDARFDEDSLLFHAHWRDPATLAPSPSSEPRDLGIADLAGRGRLVGLVLNVGNEHDQWWGEGDEKITVDGEDFPSHFGTGTEDFFGFAYCSTGLFDRAFIGQTRARLSDNHGRVSLYRWLLSDSIPFERSLRFDLEALPPAPGAVTNYDALVYWYARPGGRDNGPSPGSDAFVIPDLPPFPPETSEPVVCGSPIPPDP